MMLMNAVIRAVCLSRKNSLYLLLQEVLFFFIAGLASKSFALTSGVHKHRTV